MRATKRLRELCRGHGDEDGVSIVELIVALTLFSVLVGSLVGLIATGLSVARNNKDRSVAAHLASQEMDALRQKSFTSMTIGQSSRTTTVNSVRFTLTTDTEWVANTATSNACDSAAGTPQVVRATVTVTWPNMRGVEPVRTDTEITPPVGSYDPENGHIAVRVRDRAAAPLGAIPVRVIGPTVDQTQTTLDGSGCAFFGFLPPGTYSVTLGTSGWVDRQSNAVPSQSVGVAAESISSVAFDYDEAATIDATLAGVHGGIPANAVPVTLGNTALIPAGTKSVSGAGTLRTIGSLFPFANGLQLWTGSCADADPEGTDTSGTRYWPDATRDPAITVDPGTVTAATVGMATVRLDFARPSAGTPVTIQAVHSADSRCGSGETLTLTVVTATTDTQLVALPWGTWTIRALGETPQGWWDTVVLDPSLDQIFDAQVRIT